MRTLKVLGYVGFFFFSLFLGLYLTFPWDDARDRILAFASEKSGMTISAKSLRPHWITGVKVAGLSLKGPTDASPTEIDELTARVSLLALLTGKVGGSLAMPVAKGTLKADFARNDAGTRLDAKIDGVELALVPGFAEKVGLPFGGTLGGETEFYLDAKDPTKTEGTLALRGSELALLPGGKIAGFPIPELAIGDFDWKVPVTGGRAKFDMQTVKGENVELRVDGELALVSPLERSTLNLVVAFKPSESFLKKEPILNALLANIASAKGGDGFYSYGLTGTVKNYRFAPKRL